MGRRTDGLGGGRADIDEHHSNPHRLGPTVRLIGNAAIDADAPTWGRQLKAAER